MSRQSKRNSGEFSSWRDIYFKGAKGMGLRSFFRRHRAAVGETAGSTAVIDPVVPEPLTPAELQDAWAELTEAARDSAVKSFHACTRNGKPWQEDPASVRSMAAMLRSFPAEASSADTKPAG